MAGMDQSFLKRVPKWAIRRDGQPLQASWFKSINSILYSMPATEDAAEAGVRCACRRHDY